MGHPFEKMFERALLKSSINENHVLSEANKLCKKGYSVSEIATVLKKLKISLINEKDEEIIQEALDEFLECHQN